MKGKRYTTEEKIRALREADGGKAIREVCQERNISEATYHRWRKQFGLMDVDWLGNVSDLQEGPIESPSPRRPCGRAFHARLSNFIFSNWLSTVLSTNRSGMAAEGFYRSNVGFEREAPPPG